MLALTGHTTAHCLSDAGVHDGDPEGVPDRDRGGLHHRQREAVHHGRRAAVRHQIRTGCAKASTHAHTHTLSLSIAFSLSLSLTHTHIKINIFQQGRKGPNGSETGAGADVMNINVTNNKYHMPRIFFIIELILILLSLLLW